MLKIDIPGFGDAGLKYLVSDFSGTLSVDGIVAPETIALLNEIANILEIHVLTSDTHGTARKALSDLECQLSILTGDDHDVQKKDYVTGLGAEQVIAFGNGNNDAQMLSAAKIGVAVCLSEGCSIKALSASDITVKSIRDAIDLVRFPNRLKATLRI